VDAQSWLGFERKIQLRRFEALIASARAALAEQNVALAQHALAEAREIRADAPELLQLEAQAAQMQPPADDVWRRGATAAALLLLGSAMFIGLDAIRVLPGSLPDVTPPPPLLSSDPVAPGDQTLRPPVPARAAVSEISEPDRVVATVSAGERQSPSGATVPLQRGQSPNAGTVPGRPGLSLRSGTVPGLGDSPRVSPRAAEEIDVAPADVPIPDSTQKMPEVVRPLASATMPSVTPAVLRVESSRAVDTTADDRVRVEEVLGQYARAFGQLDARAAHAVWPSVDQRALARAFDSLASQSVSFETCDIDVRGATANASCRGRASYVGKVGRDEPRTEPRTWHFELERVGETWKIAHAEARRISG
jgi:hypothetical protein